MKKILALTLVAIVAALTFGMAVAPHTSTVTDGPVTLIHLRAAVVVQASSTNTNSSGVNGSSLWTTLYGDAVGFGNTILKGIETLLNDIFSGIGTSIQEVFQGWGYALVQQTGIFAPIVMVAILAMSFFVLQMFMALYAGEKDVEEEVEAA